MQPETEMPAGGAAVAHLFWEQGVAGSIPAPPTKKPTARKKDEAIAYKRFLKHRWPPEGNATCPRCGSVRVYVLGTRGTFKCRCCKKHFSATSGTVFAGHKLPFVKLMAFLDSGHLNALQLSRDLGVQYKVAWVMCSKLREMRAVDRSVGDQIDAKTRGYFQRGRTPDPACCERCGNLSKELQRATFRLDRRCSGYYCPECRESLARAEEDFRENYEQLRMIKEFEEEVNGINQEYGRPADVPR